MGPTPSKVFSFKQGNHNTLEILPKILSQVTPSPIKSYSPILGLGVVNKVYKLETADGNNYIIRLNEGDTISVEYPKEKWCIEKAAEHGIPGPKVFSMGEMDGWSFMIQSKVPGVNGKLLPERAEEIFHRLGEYCAIFSKIEGGIFNDGIPESPGETPRKGWLKHINYNLGELAKEENDQALQLGVFSLNEQRQIHEIFTNLIDNPFSIGLVHGDLRPGNVVVDDDEIYLLDWGTAEFHFQPFTDLALRYFECETKPPLMKAFLRGMGISQKEFKEMLPEIAKFHLLKRIDKLRWAIDKHPPVIPSFIDKIKKAISHGKKLGLLV